MSFFRFLNYNYLYGRLDYNGKKVLDVGADWGSTAEFFLKKGAKLVVAVEASPSLFQELLANAKKLSHVIPILLRVAKPEDFCELMLKYRPDVAKIDCEGCEVQLLTLPDEILSLIPEYVIETHTGAIFEAVSIKLEANNYAIWYVLPLPLHPTVKIIYASLI